jgi:predicted NBD/HSP70 family sugar kinase
LRSLEKSGFLKRGEPQRGKVGKPSIPMGLNPDGAYSIGMKIGRRSVVVLLMDFLGNVRIQMQATYKFPVPDFVFSFLKKSLGEIQKHLGEESYGRVAGIGIASPFQLWNWYEKIGANKSDMAPWRSISFDAEIAKFSDLPVLLENDATAACRAEHVYGQGKELNDFGYLFVGSFIGGGIVLNHFVYEGRTGNAGSFGSIPVNSPDDKKGQLIDHASIQWLEDILIRAGADPEQIRAQPQNWTGFPNELERWLNYTSSHLARAIIGICAVIDFEAIIIDGGFPPDIRARVTSLVAERILTEDSRGIILPEIREGRVGGNARAIGAACGPFFSEHLLNTIGGRVSFA